MKKIILLIPAVMFCLGLSSFGDEAAKSNKGKDAKAWELSKDQREKLATAHEKMATCLRSDESVKKCHEDLEKECMTVCKDHCPWMPGKHHHHHDGDEGKSKE